MVCNKYTYKYYKIELYHLYHCIYFQKTFIEYLLEPLKDIEPLNFTLDSKSLGPQRHANSILLGPFGPSGAPGAPPVAGDAAGGGTEG